MRGPDAGTMLVRALVADAKRIGCAIEILAADWTRWESATFSGARHSITLAGIGLSEWLAGLPDADFALGGHLLADIAVDSMCDTDARQVATIAALTLIDS